MARASRSRVQGAASLRRLLRRLPDAANQELGAALTVAGQNLLVRARAETPVRTGRLRRLLAVKVLLKSLRLKLGLVTKRAQGAGFYGYILDQGRKARRVKIRRGPRAGSYMNVRAIPRDRYNFVFGRRSDFISNEDAAFRSVLDRILLRAGQGIGND